MSMTMNELVDALPASHKRAATSELLHLLNNIGADDELSDSIRTNFLTYAGVLQSGKYKMHDYLKAVTFVTLKGLGKTNTEAYAMVNPEKYADLVAKGTDSKTMSAYTSGYAKGKLVMLITEQSLVPMWVLNAPYYQEAIMTQVDLMRTAQSELVRTQAANSILTHLAKPKDAAPQIAITVNNDGTAALASQLEQLVLQQQEMIRLGGTAKELAAMPLGRKNQGEVIDV